MIQYNIAVLEGDGIGPEIVNQAIKVLNKVSDKCGFRVNYTFSDVGGVAIDKYKTPLPEDTLNNCKNSDSILLGAVGGAKWEHLSLKQRPESAILKIRKEFSLFAGVKPLSVFNSLEDMSLLKKENVQKFKDILIVSDLTGGIYVGEKARRFDNGKIFAFDTEMYREDEIIRVAKVAFDLAQRRSKKLVSVDRADMLESSKFWREIVSFVSKGYKDVMLTHMRIDDCVTQIMKNPAQFDVILTSDMFENILSSEIASLTGLENLTASLNIRQDRFGLYYPINGFENCMFNKDSANPVASILAVAMMLKYSFLEDEASDIIKKAVNKSIKIGRTIDMHTKGTILLSCSEMGNLICKNIN